ncbi:prolyl-tRNA synthetase 2-like protein, mitochondrial [Lycorma delicatula]|uniref:prolyl-tRNA synthetase 2-like protein, mitochondrial n=1 Tax=Lycorma delicatula TaxID=130591 RepID=UPI003F511EC3
MRLTAVLKSKDIHTVSKLFQPFINSPAKLKSSTPTKASSRSQKLMLTAGIIHQAHNGLHHLLPLGMRALRKLISVVEKCMDNDLNAQNILVPSVTSSDLWNLTGRIELAGPELFKFNDRHNKEFILAPTHEESVANLIATIPLVSHRNLPLLLYQISNKYRDEMRPRFGLIRSKEFLMKDLYSFDKNNQSAIETYSKVSKTYENILNQIGVSYCKVAGDLGLMGGTFSHEYHYLADIGDDTLLVCNSCNSSWNSKLHSENNICHNCGSSDLKLYKGIEVGHTFLLGTRYSSILKAKYSSDSQKHEDLVMGSYGLGLTRILAAAVEVLSTENEIRWPTELAPYSVLIITPKEGSNEALVTNDLFKYLLNSLQSIDSLANDILWDDRNHLTIGRRLNEARLTGYPNIVVIGKSALEQLPLLEYHDLQKNLKVNITTDELLDRLRNKNYNICDKKMVSVS